MRFLSRVILCGMALANACPGQNADPRLRLAFVHIQTVRDADRSRSGGDMAPDLIVRLSGVGREIFAFSGRYGSVVVPLRAGKYCMQLFAKNGRRLRLSPNERCCFRVVEDQYLEVGVVAAYDPDIEVLPPPPKLP